jgi:cation transport ATPase
MIRSASTAVRGTMGYRLAMSADWEAIERAEQRLEAHSAERRSALQRRDRRRRVLPWIVAPFVLPAIGAAALLAIVEDQGGDLGSWPTGRAIAVVAACFAVPAVLAAWSARRQGIVEMLVWTVVCIGAEFAMVVGVGFLALGLGPD